MNLLDEISFARLLWGVPILLAIHNFEEAPFMEKWSKELSLPSHLAASTRQFVWAVTLLTVAGFVITYIGVNTTKQPIGVWAVLEIQTIMLVNAIAPHLVASLRFQKYNPGVVTALFLNIPFSVYLFQRAMQVGTMSWGVFCVLLAIAPFATVTLIRVSLQFGKWACRN